MYEALREGLCTADNATTPAARLRYLRSLSSMIPAVRNAYRVEGARVDLDYSDPDTQAAYLLAFFPDYARRLNYILQNEELANGLAHLRARRVIRVCSFAAGPCPEIAALCALAVTGRFPWSEIEVVAFDIDSCWTFGRNIVKKFVARALNPDITIGIKHISFDLNSDSLNAKTTELCESADLFVFQNFLNEIQNVSHLRALVERLAETMKVGAHLVVSDIGMTPNYHKARQLHGKLKNGELRKFEGDNRTIERCASLLPGSPLANLATQCPALVTNADQPFKFNYLYFVRGDQ